MYEKSCVPFSSPFSSPVAYTLSRDSLSVTPRAGREALQLAGHRITVYRKQPDGRWLLARDPHTLSPAAKLGS
jgi:ketosteroid isomerase-like protein